MNKKADKYLSKDPVLKKVIKTLSLDQLPTPSTDIYFALVRSIVYQQLSGKAAATIHGRFLDLFKDNYPSPKSVVRRRIETLRKVGLSRQKATYIQNVANFTLKEKLTNKDWSTLSDEEIIAYLTQIKGVGTWTVQMILIFYLQRPDVFPIDDLAVRLGIVELYKIKEEKKALKLKLVEISDSWKPYRSIASRYMWAWRDRE